MNYTIHPNESMQIINKTFMAYLLNKLDNHGVNLHEMKPEYPPIKIISESYYNGFDFNPHIRASRHGKVIFENRNINELQEKSIIDFMDDDIKDNIDIIALELANFITLYPTHDFIFSNLPEFSPFFHSMDRCGDTGFAARSISGTEFINGESCIIFEFQAFAVDKYRKTGEIQDEKWEIKN